MTDSTNTRDLEKLASRSVWIWDLDDCWYPIDSGLHDRIKKNIVQTYADELRKIPNGQQISDRVYDLVTQQGNTIEDPTRIREDELGVAFPSILQAFQNYFLANGRSSKTWEEKFSELLSKMYGEEYQLLTPDNKLVEAFNIASSKGRDIYLLTNGPSAHSTTENHLHVQKVMKALGFSGDVIQSLIADGKIYDLQKSIQDGAGKPSVENMRNFISFSGITDPEDCFMADDSPKNLKVASDFGMASLWTWTSRTEPKTQDKKLASEIGAVRSRDTGQTFYDLAHIAS